MDKIVKCIDGGEGCGVLVARIRNLGYSPNLHRVEGGVHRSTYT